MKKTQIKDTLRNVRKHIVSYISVIAVAMLAVAAFLGINYAADALIINASDFETNLNFRDIEITSTMLLTDEDIDAIKKTDGVSDVEGIYQTSAKVFGKKEKQSVYFEEYPRRSSQGNCYDCDRCGLLHTAGNRLLFTEWNRRCHRKTVQRNS